MPELWRVAFQLTGNPKFAALNPRNICVDPDSFSQIGLDDVAGMPVISFYATCLLRPARPSIVGSGNAIEHVSANLDDLVAIDDATIPPPPIVAVASYDAITTATLNFIDRLRAVRDTRSTDQLPVTHLNVTLELARILTRS